MAIFFRLLLFALGLGAAAQTSHYLQSEFTAKRAEQHFLYLPSSRYLDAMSLGYKTVMADVIYLWSIQYFHPQPGAHIRFDYLWHIYDVITDLDPKFIDAYYTGHYIMAVDAENRDMAVRILEKGFAINPDEWMFMFTAGYLRYEEQRYLEAAEYFSRAMAIPGASGTVRRMYAGMLARAGQLDQAFSVWRQIYLESEIIWVRHLAVRHMYDIDTQRDKALIRSAIEAYAAAFGRRPAKIMDLVRSGHLKDVPKDPYFRPYRYDPVTDEIISPSTFSYKTLPPRLVEP